MPMEWMGPEAMKAIRHEVANRVDMASRFIRDRAKKLVSRSQPVVIYGKGAGRSRKGLKPSEAGDPPKMVTGTLRLGIRKEFDRVRIEARVGTNVPYGKFLELGTRKMAARPWLRPTLTHNAPELRARFGIGVKV